MWKTLRYEDLFLELCITEAFQLVEVKSAAIVFVGSHRAHLIHCGQNRKFVWIREFGQLITRHPVVGVGWVGDK